jgi:hypothetical protein
LPGRAVYTESGANFNYVRVGWNSSRQNNAWQKNNRLNAKVVGRKLLAK